MATETEQLVVTLEARIRDFEKNFQKANRTASTQFSAIERRGKQAGDRIERDMTRATTGITASFASMGGGITKALGFIGVGIGIDRLAHSIRGVVAEAAGLVDTADKIGVSTTALQQLRFAGQQAGVEMGELDGALAFFSKTIGEASRGSGELYEILTANGVAIRDQAGNVRPLLSLFGDYADLVSRAASTQERNLLVIRAFGRAADEMGNLFQDGAAGVDEATAAATRLGAVIDEGKLRRIAEIDDAWEAFATTLTTNVKSAILGTVDDIDTLLDRMNAVEEQSKRNVETKLAAIYEQRTRLQGDIAELEGAFTGALDEPTQAMIVKSLEQAKGRLEELTQQALALREILDRRQGYFPAGTAAPTPTTPTVATATTVPATGDETPAKLTAIAEKAGQASDEIIALVEAQERFRQGGQYLGESVVSALDAIIVRGDTAKDAIANLAKQLASAALQAGLLGSGPLAGLFGAAVPAVIGGGPINLVPRAEGGPVSRGKAYLVGERGPELMIPKSAGNVIPNHKLGGGAVTLNAPINITVEGGSRGQEADRELAERITAQTKNALRQVIAEEMRTQMRPGGMLVA